MTVETSLVSSLVACVLFFGLVVVFYVGRPEEERRFLLPLATGSFVIKVALVPLYYHFLYSVGLEGFAYFDSVKYHLASVKMSQDIALGRPWEGFGWSIRDPGYGFIGAVLYWIFGPNVLIPRFLNVAVGCMTLLYVYRVARMAFDQKAARVAAVLMAVIPFTLLITLNHRKEPFIQFFAMLVFYHAFCVFRQDKRLFGHLAFLVLGLFGMSFFRGGFILPFLAVMVISFLISQRNLIVGFGLAGVTTLGVLAFQFLLSGGDPGSGLEGDVNRFQAKLERSGQYSQVGGLLRYARITSIFEFYKVPMAVALFIIMPFPPYFIETVPTILLSWANLFWLALLPQTIRGAWSLVRREDWRLYLPVLVFPAAFLVLLSITNVGIVRYRETISPMLMVLAAGGLGLKSNMMLNSLVYGGLAALGLVVYAIRA